MGDPRERVIPGPGQESVWDYPRPPACVRSGRHVEVRWDGVLVADSRAAWRVLETSHPPTWYIPPGDVAVGALSRSAAAPTYCEWKGSATYWDVAVPGGRSLAAAAWCYEHPTPGYVQLADHVAFSPSRFECSVDGERVRPQDGGFYAGWITDDVVGPFKGGPGTMGW
jgi:uncharacterized protein (DUF427 family)